ncbi:MAG: YggT family protein [Ktedonobacterales bacterium]|nr:YggT family protein [Ktedonobacterales bacterium]
MNFPGGGPLHFIIQVFFGFLILSLFVRAILSWFPLTPSNPLVRFFDTVTTPVLMPVRKRLPAMSIGMFDIGWTVAFLFAWWALTLLAGLLSGALPSGW